MEIVKEVIPSDAFYGNGSGLGPAVFMIDDSIVEQAALSKCWPMAKFSSAPFTFFRGAGHGSMIEKRIQKEGHVLLIQHIRSTVYSKIEEELGSKYTSLTSLEIAQKYPHLLKNINAQWENVAYIMGPLLQEIYHHKGGNHTYNYAEEGIRILKDLVVVRVKAYNLVQMFYFIVETTDIYYKRNIANNRLESYIAVRFRGLDAKLRKKRYTTRVVHSSKPVSQTDQVNVHIGVWCMYLH